MQRRVVVPHVELQRDLRELQGLIAQVSHSVEGAVEGAWSEAYARAMATFGTGAGADQIKALTDTAEQLARYGEKTRADAAYYKNMIVIQLNLFLVEWSLIMAMAVWNPFGALAEQAVLRATYRAVLRSLIFRFLAGLAAQEVLNVGLAAATHEFAKWLTSEQGYVLEDSDELLKQAVGFGALQGVFGAFVPFVGGALGGLLGKAFGRDAAGALRGAVDAALAEARQVKGAGRDVAGEVAGSGVRPVAADFGRDLAGRTVNLARVLREVRPGGVSDEVFTGVGEVFARELGAVMGDAAARRVGEEWARAFTRSFGGRGMEAALAVPLRALPRDMGALRRVLSQDVARMFAPDFGRKVASLAGEAALWGGAMNLAEGTYNAITTGHFTTSLASFTSGAFGALLGHAGARLGGKAGWKLRSALGLGRTPTVSTAGAGGAGGAGAGGVNALPGPGHPLLRPAADLRFTPPRTVSDGLPSYYRPAPDTPLSATTAQTAGFGGPSAHAVVGGRGGVSGPSARWEEFQRQRDGAYHDRLVAAERLAGGRLEAAREEFTRRDVFGGRYLPTGETARERVLEVYHTHVRTRLEELAGQEDGSGHVTPEQHRRVLAEADAALPRMWEQVAHDQAFSERFERAVADYRRQDLFGGRYVSGGDPAPAGRAAPVGPGSLTGEERRIRQQETLEDVRQGRVPVSPEQLRDRLRAVHRQAVAELHHASLGPDTPAARRQIEELEARIARMHEEIPRQIRDLGVRERQVGQELDAFDTLVERRGIRHELPDPVVLERARADLAEQLRTAHAVLRERHGDGGLFEDRWQQHVRETTSARVLEQRLQYAEVREERLRQGRAVFRDAADEFEDSGSLTKGPPLGEEGRERLARAFDEDVEHLLDADWFSRPGHVDFRRPPRPDGEDGAGAEDGGRPAAGGGEAPGTSYQKALDALRSGLPRRMVHETERQHLMERAGRDFHTLAGHPDSPAHHYDVDEPTLERLAADFREDTLRVHDRIQSDADPALVPASEERLAAWLHHEARHENAFHRAYTTARATPPPHTRTSGGPSAPDARGDAAAGALPGTGTRPGPHTGASAADPAGAPVDPPPATPGTAPGSPARTPQRTTEPGPVRAAGEDAPDVRVTRRTSAADRVTEDGEAPHGEQVRLASGPPRTDARRQEGARRTPGGLLGGAPAHEAVDREVAEQPVPGGSRSSGRRAAGPTPARADLGAFAAAVREEPLLTGLSPDVVREAVGIQQRWNPTTVSIGDDAGTRLRRERWWGEVRQVALALTEHGTTAAEAKAREFARTTAEAVPGAGGRGGPGHAGPHGDALSGQEQTSGATGSEGGGPAPASPDGTVTPHPVTEFSLPEAVTRLARDDGAGELGLVHLAPIPEEPVALLRAQVIRDLADRPGGRPGLLGTMSAWAGQLAGGHRSLEHALAERLTPAALAARQRDLLGSGGVEIAEPFRSRGIPYVLRVRQRLAAPRQAVLRLADRPGGVQQWTLPTTASGVSGGNSDVRTGSLAWPRPLALTGSHAPQSAAIGPRISATVNQRATTASASVTTRSINLQGAHAEHSELYHYDATLEYRLTTPTEETYSAGPEAQSWQRVPGLSWEQPAFFPAHLLRAAGESPETRLRPAPWEVVKEQVPLVGVDAFPHHELLYLAVLEGFPEVRDLAPESREVLRHYFSEGNVRGGFVVPASPLLHDTRGTAVGFFTLQFDLVWSDSTGYLGRTTNTVLESGDIIRVTSSATGLSVTNGVGLSVSGDLGWLGGGLHLAGNLGTQYRESHGISTSHGVLKSFGLRSSAPHVLQRAELRPRIRLVRAEGAPLEPRGGPLASADAAYPVTLRVPAAASVQAPPDRTPTRVHPPRDVRENAPGLLSTPVGMTGAEGFFGELRNVLHGLGYLPGEGAASGDAVTNRHRLVNARLLEEARTAAGLRDLVTEPRVLVFELPGSIGVSRLAVRVGVEPLRTGEPDAEASHLLFAPDIRVLNFTASFGEATEQRTRSTAALSAGLSVSGGGPVSASAGLSGEVGYGYSRQSGVTDAAATSIGEEQYFISSPGVHITERPGLLRARFSDENMTDLAAEVRVRMAVPDYRMLEEPGQDGATPRPRIRDVTTEDETTLARRAAGEEPRFYPRAAFLERLTAAEAVQEAVLRAVGAGPDARAAGAAGEAGEAPAHEMADLGPRMPGSYDDRGDTDREPRRPSHLSLAAGRLREATVGEDARNPASMLPVMVRSALSLSHLLDLLPAMIRDPGGVLVPLGDVQVQLHAYLTDVRRLPRTSDGVVTERWHMAGSGTDVTGSRGSGHTPSGTFGTVTAPIGFSARYGEGFSGGAGTTRSDRSTSYRITTEEGPLPGHHFRAGLVVTVQVLPGRPGLLAGLLPRRPERTVAVEAAEAVDFLVHATDLHKDGGLSALVARTDAAPSSAPEPATTAGPTPGAHTTTAADVTTASGPAPAAVPDRPLPASFVASGNLGLAAVTEIAPHPGHPHLIDEVRRTVNAVAPGALTPGSTSYTPQAAKAVQEMTSERGLAQAVATRHMSVSFPYTGWLGPYLVTLSVRADPTPGFEKVRGRPTVSGKGLETQLLRSTGEGSALAGPGATAHSSSDSRSRAVNVTFPVKGLVGASLGDGNEHSNTWGRTHTRDRRVWLHAGEHTVLEATGVPYTVHVEASARSLENVLGMLPRLLLPRVVHDGAAVLADALLRASRLDGAVRAPLRASAVAAITATIRFGGVNEGTGPEHWPGPVVTPVVVSDDPAEATAAPGDSVTVSLGPILRTGAWRPRGPLEIHHFDALPHLARALREVAPALERREGPSAQTLSTEGLLIRLRELIRTDRLVELKAENVAPFVGGPGVDGPALRVQLYDPVTVYAGVDFSQDDIEVTSSGATSGVTARTAPTAGLSGGQGFSLGASAGNRPQRGRTAGIGRQERFYLRAGTTQPSPDGTGVTGYQVAAVAKVTVRGPDGAHRYVLGNIHLRTLDRPPSTALNRAEFSAAADDALRAVARMPDTRPETPNPALRLLAELWDAVLLPDRAGTRPAALPESVEWQRLDGSRTAVTRVLRERGQGTFALVLDTSPRTGGPHALAAYHTRDGGVLWTVLDVRDGGRLLPDDATVPGDDIVVALFDRTGVPIRHPDDVTGASLTGTNRPQAVAGVQVADAAGARDRATEDNGTENTATENIATENIATENIATENIATEDIATEDIATEDIATEDIATEDIATEDIATEDIATEDIATEDIATEDIATENIATENIATENIATEDSDGAGRDGASDTRALEQRILDILRGDDRPRRTPYPDPHPTDEQAAHGTGGGDHRHLLPGGPDTHVRLPGSRRALEDLVDRAVETVTSAVRPDSPGFCVELLVGILRELHPGKMSPIVRSARSMDDIAIGSRETRHRIGPDAHWTRMTSWQEIERALTDAPAGSAAAILWRPSDGVGHALMAYRTADALQPVHWVNPENRKGDRLVTLRHLHPPVDVRALIIDAEGTRIDQRGEPVSGESSSAVHALTDPPSTLEYGKGSTELEVYSGYIEGKYPTSGGPVDIEPKALPYLARNPAYGIRIDVDGAPFSFLGTKDVAMGHVSRPDVTQRVPLWVFEVVVEAPMVVLEGETDPLGRTPSQVFRHLGRLFEGLDLRVSQVAGERLRRRRIPLADIFRPQDGYELHPAAQHMYYTPAVGGEAVMVHPQYTYGVTPAALTEFGESILPYIRRDPTGNILAAEHLEDALVFSRAESAMLVTLAEETGVHLTPKDIKELEGLLLLVYVTGAAFASLMTLNGLGKSQTAILSRNDLHRVRAELGGGAGRLLDAAARQVAADFEASLLRRMPNFLRQYTQESGTAVTRPLEAHYMGLELGRIIESGTRQDGPRITQREIFGIMFTLPDLDRSLNRSHNRSLVVVEIRHFGVNDVVRFEAAERYFELLTAMVRQATDNANDALGS
ncbi:hypothetical protein [Streptomyces sp. E-15]